VRRERTVAFSDGVFAIAITLLVLTIQIPDLHTETSRALDHLLDGELPDLVAYFIGFYVIGGFWYRHHMFFDSLKGFDRQLLIANMVFLSLIALLPFPTAVLGDHPGLTVAVVLFAVAVALAGLADTGMLVLALRRGLLSVEEERHRRQYLARSLLAPAIFLFSIPLAFASPAATKWVWVGFLVVGPRLATRIGWIRPWSGR
jgi:uncharacterized membrane protein